MPAFQTRVDIANRALQHVGASRIVTLADDDKGAAEVGACYEQLREAELRSNNWRFAIRRAVLYPIVTPITSLPDPSAPAIPPITNSATLPTMTFVPPTWSAGAAYDFGAIVQDANGDWWQSSVPANVGNPPGVDGTTQWDSYFGSPCVFPFDASKAYMANDLVYEDIGNGAFNIYLCRQNNISVDPGAGTPWLATTAYNVGDVVVDPQGFFWRSTISQNLANQPGVYGAWSATPNYQPGALVVATDRKLYLALVANQNHNPAGGASPTQWQLVGNPGSWPMWNSATTYAQNAIVAGTDGALYLSYQNGNIGHDPTTQPAFNPNAPLSTFWVSLGLLNPWSAAFTSSTASVEWLPLDGALTPINIVYPLGAGPASQSQTRNVFVLPQGYLRRAPQDPKAGSTSFLGAPSGRAYDDWEFEGNYIVSRQSEAIILRFIADIRQVPKMDPMFCEGLAARIGLEVCETLTQSNAKIGTITGVYKKFMDSARTQSGIETGPVEPAEDDYITCRL